MARSPAGRGRTSASRQAEGGSPRLTARAVRVTPRMRTAALICSGCQLADCGRSMRFQVHSRHRLTHVAGFNWLLNTTFVVNMYFYPSVVNSNQIISDPIGLDRSA